MKKVILAVLGVLGLVQMAAADPIGGGVCRDATVGAFSVREFTVDLHAGETTMISLSGDGDTDLDVYVYDDNGNLITSDTGSSDQALVALYPYRTSRFTIRIVNRGSVYNNFRVCAT